MVVGQSLQPDFFIEKGNGEPHRSLEKLRICPRTQG